jgi:DNA-binding protein HU-beta
MNKTELLEIIAKDVKIPKTVAGQAIDTILAAITKALAKGDVVTFVGFGSFATSKRKARNGRDPRSGKTLHIPAKVVPKFRAGKKLKDAVAK